MNKENIIKALIILEEKYYRQEGYDVTEILNVLKLPICRKNEKTLRRYLRSLISKIEHPEFLTAGNEDIVYCPKGKSSGYYRLSSKFREDNLLKIKGYINEQRI